MRGQGKFNVFAEQEARTFLQTRLQEAKDEIRSESEDYILNVNQTEYVKSLVDQYRVDIPRLHFDKKTIDSEEREVRGRGPYGPTTRTRQAIIYYIPFQGDPDLLKLRPNPRKMWTDKMWLEDSCLCFEVISKGDDADRVQSRADTTMERLEKQLDNLRKQLTSWNDQLKVEIRNAFEERKDGFLEKNDLLEALDAPVRKREDAPETYSIPTPEPREVTPKPSAPEKGYTPEPTLNEEVYEEILKVLHNTGKQFERLPSTYSGKDEEELRDHLLLQLEPQFEGASTGETFNKSGKTDILIRHEGHNVFVSECAFWHGQERYHKKLDQLLENLTWRDSKTALVLFVDNQDFTAVLDKIEETTCDHEHFVDFVGKQDDTWLEYRFHIPGDPNKEVRLVVLAFHMPD